MYKVINQKNKSDILGHWCYQYSYTNALYEIIIKQFIDNSIENNCAGITTSE